MEFQYTDEFKKLASQCPPAMYSTKNIVIFRWVFEDIKDARNFLPLPYRNPKRFLNLDDVTKCQSFSLSLYDTEHNAKQQFTKLRNKIGINIYKTIGTNIAKAEITEKDGVSDEPNATTGHISHHFAVGFDYEDTFTIISNL
jgi:hypothetical protein